MQRLIDADALYNGTMKDEYFRFKETDKSGREAFAYSCAMQRLAEAPTIQPDAPRVMMLEELAAAQKTPVWRETKRAHKDLYNGWMLAYDIQRGQGITGMRQGMTEPNGRVGWCKLDDYGKTWRCWTARPTDEQKKAVKWDETHAVE